ncbi:hypothetical protein BDU57DRAFT_199939 [Ampelomyces quisqualis]|uniref:Uncharacterized protein n=1 Tax=Ampelomyces quisqualis TaxID=50730 RepID=A0A6A5QST4_AMPQU|nr:hypothetical protein BDU57DRAFT_199939 [Ampelomyces quisqualis]
MEGAFTHMGNHLVSDSAATINAGAGDDESILDHGLTGAQRQACAAGRARGRTARARLRLLRHPQRRQRRQVPGLQQVVLQRSRQLVVVARDQPPGPRPPQGGAAAPRLVARRHDARVLQLRHQERLPAGLHPRQVGHGRRAAVPPAVRLDALAEGHELGHVALAAADRGPLLPALAGARPHRPGAAARAPPQPADHRQARGAVEGQRQRHHRRPREGRGARGAHRQGPAALRRCLPVPECLRPPGQDRGRLRPQAKGVAVTRQPRRALGHGPEQQAHGELHSSQARAR